MRYPRVDVSGPAFSPEKCNRRMKDSDRTASVRLRSPLIRKYRTVLFAVVIVPLLISGASDAWFGYRDQTAMLSQRLRAEANVAAEKIQGFLDNVTAQLGWTVQLPWTASSEDQHRFDVLRLLRQVPAVIEVTLIDGNGVERLHVSRITPDLLNSGANRRDDPAVRGARSDKVWFGPVTWYEGSEPHLTVAIAGAREVNGVAVAVINLRLI